MLEDDQQGAAGDPGAGHRQGNPGKALPAVAAEELAALVSAQVEAVVTRLVEERLPAIVESAIAQEIEKIRTSLESEK